MWSVVFYEDKSVEVVPIFWYKNKKCAWPKKNYKKSINHKVQPNEIEFDYLHVRKL